MADIVIVALIIAYCVFLYVRHRKKKKEGTAGGCSGCCGDCRGCGGVPYSEMFKDKQEGSDG